MKLSVIVPFYNSEKTLARCIESILRQTFTDFELLLINDGSTDSSAAIANAYALQDCRIQLIHKEHSGVSAARNLGLKKASGSYIQFTDSDDYQEPDMLLVLYTMCCQHHADLAVCNYTHPCIKNYLGNRILDGTAPEDLLAYCQTTFSFVVPWNKLYRREVITAFFDEDVHFAEDDCFALSNLHTVKKLVSTDRVLYHYYAAPADTPLEECSCINRIPREERFWEKKHTYWYQRAALLDRTKAVLYQHFPREIADDFAYARIFDFMIWELLIFHFMHADTNGILLEIQSVFKEPDFIRSLQLKEKFGVRLKRFSHDQLLKLTEYYVRSCIRASEKIAADPSAYREFYIYLGFFVRLFTEPSDMPLNPADLVADMYLQLALNHSPEARYVNSCCMTEECV